MGLLQATAVRGYNAFQQEIRVLHGTVVSGNYVFRAFNYMILLLKVTMYSVVKYNRVFLPSIPTTRGMPKTEAIH